MKTTLMAIVIAMTAPIAVAQSNLGELLDQGAKKVSKEEWIASIPKTSTGVTPSGRADINLTYKTDGTLTGNAQATSGGSSSGVSGTWTVDEAGKVCIKESFHAWNQTYEGCGFSFKLGEQYWASRSDSDRTAGVVKVNYRK